MAERSLVYRFEGRFDNLKGGLATAGKSVDDFGAKLMKADRNGAQMRAGLTELGSTAGKVGLAAAAGLGAVVMASANFDQAMSNVKAATHESAKNMDLLREAAIQAGASTKFSATEAASAIEELAKAGVSVKDILDGGLDGAMALAAAGNVEVGQAAEFTATALNQFSLSGDKASHVADLLAAGAGKAQGEVADMAKALNYVGVPAANLGVSIEEAAGSIALLASNGIIGEQAGTSLRGMLASLTSPSEVARDQMQALGIEVFDASGKFIGFEGVAGQLQATMSGLTDAERANALGRVFGTEQLQAANVLYREGAAGVREMTAAVDDSGYAAETASMRMDNLKGDWEEFTGALETALIGAGDGAQGPLRQLVKGATEVVDVFNGMPPAAQTTATALLGVTAVAGGGLWALSKTVNAVHDVKDAFGQLGVKGTKVKGVIAGVGKAAGAAAILFAGFNIAESISRIGEDEVAGVEAMRDALLGLADAKIGSDFAANFDDIGKSIDRLTDKSVGESINDSLAGAVGFGTGKSFDQATAQLANLDSALADLVGSGNPEKAKEALASLGEAQNLSGKEMEQLSSLLPGYQEALAAQSADAKLAAESEAELAGATQTLTTAQGQSVQMTAEQAEAFKGAQDAARETADSFLTLGESLNDPKVALTDWISQLETQAKALRDFTSNSQTAIKRGLSEGFVSELQAAGAEGALRMEQLANATDEEIARASRAFEEGEAASNSFVDAVTSGLNEVNETTAKPHIEIDGGQAYVVIKGVRTKVEDVNNLKAVAKLLADGSSIPGAVAQAQATLNSLKSKDVWITTYLRTITGPADQTKRRGKNAPPTMFSNADGGTIGRAAWGTTVPDDGGGYRDFLPYLLAPLEEVVSNRRGQAEKYRPELKLINRDAPAHMVAESLLARMQLGRLANGGTVSGLAGGGTAKRPPKGQRDLPGDIWGRGIPELSGGLRALNREVARSERAVKKQTAVVEAETKVRDALVGKQQAAASEVSGQFMSDPFGQKSNPFIAGTSGWKATFEADIAGAKERQQLQALLGKQGLDGDAFAALGKASNADLKALLQSGQAREFERLFNLRATETGRAGAQAGDIAYGKDVRLANAGLRESKRELQQANRWLKQIEKRANQAERDRKQAAKDRKAAPAKAGAATGKAVSGSANRGRSNVRK